MSNQAAHLFLQPTPVPLSAEPHLVLRRELARRQVGAGASQAVAAVEVAGPAAGVYAIRNRRTGRVYVSADLNVADVLEYDRHQLQRKQHRNAALQADWDFYGAENFTFKVVATIEPRFERNVHGKLVQLLDLSREELGAYGESGYNSRVSVPV